MNIYACTALPSLFLFAIIALVIRNICAKLSALSQNPGQSLASVLYLCVYSVHGLVWVIVSMELATKILNIMRTRV